MGRRNAPIPGKYKEIKEMNATESNGQVYYEDKSTTVI